MFVRKLHDVPQDTPCRDVLPGVREFLRIGGWIALVMGIVMVGYSGWSLRHHLPAMFQHRTGIRYGILVAILLLIMVALGIAVPIITIQYTNTLRDTSTVGNTSTPGTSVGRCLTVAPYRRETIDVMAWFNVVSVVIIGGVMSIR